MTYERTAYIRGYLNYLHVQEERTQDRISQVSDLYEFDIEELEVDHGYGKLWDELKEQSLFPAMTNFTESELISIIELVKTEKMLIRKRGPEPKHRGRIDSNAVGVL
jgi:hypothetical protein